MVSKQASPYPLPAGSKIMIHKNAGMPAILEQLLYSPNGVSTVSAIHDRTDIPCTLIAGHLLRLKRYGIVANSYKPADCDNSKLWWIVPIIRTNLELFLQSIRASE